MVALGLWHIYKQAQLVVWSYCASFFFGPLFHALFPGQTFNWRPKHKWLTWMLSLVRLAWGHVKADFNRVWNTVAIDDISKRYMQNLFLLCEYFLPVVITNFSFITLILGARFWILDSRSGWRARA